MNRYLMEDKYIPKKLNDVLTPNFEIIKKIQEHIDKDNMNLLFIGSIYTFKMLNVLYFSTTGSKKDLSDKLEEEFDTIIVSIKFTIYFSIFLN
jgi:hypothetical protein